MLGNNEYGELGYNSLYNSTKYHLQNGYNWTNTEVYFCTNTHAVAAPIDTWFGMNPSPSLIVFKLSPIELFNKPIQWNAIVYHSNRITNWYSFNIIGLYYAKSQKMLKIIKIQKL